jgi:hypothetical protein
VKAFHFYKKMNGTTSPTPPEMPIIGRLLTIPRGRLERGTGLVRTEAETPPMCYGSKTTYRTASWEGSKNEAVQADEGLWRPGSAQDPSASASRRDRMEDRDDKILPLFRVPANHTKVVFGHASLNRNPNSLCLHSAFRGHLPRVAPSGLVAAARFGVAETRSRRYVGSR